MEATAAERALATAVASRVAAIYDKIKEHRDAGKPMSARHAAVISAMIDDIAAAHDAEETPKTSGRRKARKGAARWNEELSRLDEAKPGVVVKSVHGRDAGDILREACFMAACQGHTSIIGYRGVTRTPGIEDDGDDEYYLVAADSAGGLRSLADVLRDHGRPFPEADVRRIMRQLLGGAEAMAERGVVHRDINPGNVVYGGGRTFKITGFGAAKHAAEKDPPNPFAGTNGYTAPEVLLENAGHGAPVDAWSLGCVMLELLTGKLPFAGEDDDKADQLSKIFDVLGLPGRKAWQGLRPRVPASEVQLRQTRKHQIVGQCNTLREVVPEKVLSEEGFEVLIGLLNCDPKKRLTAAAALQRPWFTDNALNDDDALLLSAALAKITSAATESWSMVLQTAVSCAGRMLQLLRPQGIAQVMIAM